METTVQPGRTMVRTGLRMMPTFPSSSLKFRTVGFPQYGFKVWQSQRDLPLRFVFAQWCRRDDPFMSAPIIQGESSIHCTATPQGSSLRSKLCCLGPSSLVDPIRPTGEHAAISPYGLYATPSLCTCVPTQLASGSELSLSIPSRRAIFITPESSSTAYAQFLRRRRWLSSVIERFSTLISRHPLLVRVFTRLNPFACATARRVASLLGGSDWRNRQPTEAFTFGLSMSRSPFSLPNMTTVATEQSPLTGLSPVGIAASFAAAITSTPTFTSTTTCA